MTANMTLVPASGGLTAAQAAERLQADGPNAVARPRPRRLAGRIMHQLTDPLVALLVAAAAVTAALGDVPDTAVIALVIIVNTAIGVTQELRADRAIAALDALTAPTTRVVRDGADVVVPTAEVVRGDLVRLEAGDVVPADLTVTTAYRLQLDESALTGESVPVARSVGDQARAGTVVVAGRGTATVIRIGADSGLGRIAALVAATRPGKTPLQRRLAYLGRVIGTTVVILSALVFALGVAAGRPVVVMAITAVSLVVAAVPESLPAVVTLALALGARRMAAARAIPRRLAAVETLGSVTVVASDKTGTLTEGRMAVQRAVTADDLEYVVVGVGHEPQARISGLTGAYAMPPPPLVELARAGALCNDAVLVPPTADAPQWSAAGDPLEAALVTFAVRCGLDPHRERMRWPRVTEHPFDQSTRRMTTVHAAPDGRFLIVCKGAPETVLTPDIVTAGPAPLAAAVTTAQRLADAGLRVIALAAGYPCAEPDPAVPTGLSWTGLLAVGDPVRVNAPTTARSFADAGIRLLLVTGDHPGTAAAVGRQVGIWQAGDLVAHGDDGLPDGDTVDQVRVFARTQPAQKLDLVSALQRRGHVVAVTGDGVNDAPALRRADIGVAMGGGTEVARQAADLVLVDDNLATVSAAVHEGRRIYDNIRRFLRYGLSGGYAELVVMLAGPFLGLGVPLLPAQILWVNLLTHGLPGVALGVEPAEPGIMRRPPRSPQESVLGDGLLHAVLVAGTLIAAVVLGAGLAAYHLGRPWQSVVFMVLGLAQLGVAMAVRAPRRPGRPGNPSLTAAVVCSAVLQVAGVALPPLRALLGTEPLDALDLLACGAAATLPALGLRLMVAGRTGR